MVGMVSFIQMVQAAKETKLDPTQFHRMLKGQLSIAQAELLTTLILGSQYDLKSLVKMSLKKIIAALPDQYAYQEPIAPQLMLAVIDSDNGPRARKAIDYGGRKKKKISANAGQNEPFIAPFSPPETPPFYPGKGKTLPTYFNPMHTTPDLELDFTHDDGEPAPRYTPKELYVAGEALEEPRFAEWSPMPSTEELYLDHDDGRLPMEWAVDIKENYHGLDNELIAPRVAAPIPDSGLDDGSYADLPAELAAVLNAGSDANLDADSAAAPDADTYISFVGFKPAPDAGNPPDPYLVKTFGLTQ